jgi:hypothetical protein
VEEQIDTKAHTENGISDPSGTLKKEQKKTASKDNGTEALGTNGNGTVQKDHHDGMSPSHGHVRLVL